MSTADFQNFVVVFVMPLLLVAVAMTVSIVIVLGFITIARLVNEA